MAIRTIIGLLILSVIQGCAKIGNPSGGPQDVLPPEYLSGSPENRSLNFSEDQININFNEYITLKDQNREVIVSPPMDEKPVIRVREKSIRISLNEDLLPQTTYTVNFGKSISDLNEGNMLPDFEFVFSTGDVIDSLSVTGKVVDAFTREPVKETSMLVMLYENLSDSAPLLEIPRYYTKANQFGLFAINNIRQDTFRIVAVNDGNNNLKYDPGLENIAFTDSFIVINPGNVKSQTFIKDTIKIITPVQVTVRGNRRDTATVADTVIAPGKKLNAVSVSLYSFLEEGSRVMVTSRTREIPEQFTFTFNRPLIDTLEVVPLNFSPDSGWILPEPSRNNDTITYWITDTLISKIDTLRLAITYLTSDSSGLLISKSDTVRLRKPSATTGTARGGGGRRSREISETVINELVLNGNVSNRGTLNLNSQLIFTASRPVKYLNPDSIELVVFQDSLILPRKFTVSRDTISARKFIVSTAWDEETQYDILLKPGTIHDLYGKTNDSTEIRFSTRPVDYYGRILLDFSSYIYPMIIQVTSEKGVVMRTAVADQAGVFTFDYILPGRYSFKAIYDANENGKWDTGDYLKQLQPERTFLSGRPEQLRSNWDWEPVWRINDNSGE